MSRISDIARYSWEGMTGLQKAAAVAVPAIVLIITAWLAVGYLRTSIEIRQLERQANAAKREAENALAKAAKIAREKLEAERKLAELEAKRDAKITEAEKAHIDTIDAQLELDRALRERRTDNPSTEQLCAELRALGYPCG